MVNWQHLKSHLSLIPQLLQIKDTLWACKTTTMQNSTLAWVLTSQNATPHKEPLCTSFVCWQSRKATQ